MKKLFFTLLTLCLCGATYAADFNAEVTNADGTSTTFYFNILETTDDSYQVEVTYGSARQPSSSVANVYSGAITVPETVTYQDVTYDVVGLGDYAFARSAGLTSLVIPGCITYLGDHASSNCTSLTSVILQESDTPITAGYESSNDQGVFRYSTALSEVICNRNIDVITDHYCAPFRGCTGLTKVSIGGKATEVCDYAFYDCSALTDVTLSDSITSINQCAFCYCSSLEKIVIPASVTSYGIDAFGECSSLETVVLLDKTANVTLSGSGSSRVFYSDTGITFYVPTGSAPAYLASNWEDAVLTDNDNWNFLEYTNGISENAGDGNGTYYATYYTDAVGEFGDDVIPCIVTGEEEGSVTYSSISGYIPANTGLLLVAQASGTTYYYHPYGVTEATANVEGNMLYGNLEDAQTTQPATTGYYYYKLSRDHDGDAYSVGFYWGADEGAAFLNPAGKAYLSLPSDSNSLSGISLKKGEGEDTTGISAIESASEKAVSGIYTIQGVRVSNMNQPGLYIVDGKKVLKR